MHKINHTLSPPFKGGDKDLRLKKNVQYIKSIGHFYFQIQVSELLTQLDKYYVLKKGLVGYGFFFVIQFTRSADSSFQASKNH